MSDDIAMPGDPDEKGDKLKSADAKPARKRNEAIRKVEDEQEPMDKGVSERRAPAQYDEDDEVPAQYEG